jgi:hypothetical protein
VQQAALAERGIGSYRIEVRTDSESNRFSGSMVQTAFLDVASLVQETGLVVYIFQMLSLVRLRDVDKSVGIGAFLFLFCSILRCGAAWNLQLYNIKVYCSRTPMKPEWLLCLLLGLPSKASNNLRNRLVGHSTMICLSCELSQFTPSSQGLQEQSVDLNFAELRSYM